MAIAVLFVVILRFFLADSCAVDLLRKCGLLAHTSAAFLKNCCTEKLFNPPAAENRFHSLICTSFQNP